MRKWVTLVAVLVRTVVSQDDNYKTFPYMYLSSEDNLTTYVDIGRNIPLDNLIDPWLQSSTDNVTILQPFHQADISYGSFVGKINKTSFANCTATSVSNHGYSAIICNGNNLYLISVYEVIAITSFSATDSNCSIGGDLSCQTVNFDGQVTAGFVTCLKNTSDNVSVVLYAFQLTPFNGSITKSCTCAQITNSSMAESGAFNLKTAIVGVQYLNNSMPNLQIVNATILVRPYSKNKNDPSYDYIVKFIVQLRLDKNTVIVEDSSFGQRKKSDIIPHGFDLSSIFCTTAFRFQYLFKTNCMFVATIHSELFTSVTDIYFMNVSLNNLDEYTIVKKVTMEFSTQTEIHVDDVYLLSSSFNLTKQAGGKVALRLIDIYSVFSETYDQQSALIYESVDFFIGETDSLEAANRTAAVEQMTGDPSDGGSYNGQGCSSRIYANSRMAVLDFIFSGGEYSHIAVVDLDTMALKRFNLTRQKVDLISFAVSGDEALSFYNRYNKTTQTYTITKISNSKPFIGITNRNQKLFSYFFNLMSLQDNESKSVNFYLNGTFIDNMANFIEIESGFFRQFFTYYANLDYNFYLPWENIRGADIVLKHLQGGEESPTSSAFKYINQTVLLDITINVPPSYFICDDFLVLLDKNIPNKSITIMIFKLHNESNTILEFHSVNNQTITLEPGELFSFDDTTLKTVRVYYANIICLLGIHSFKPATVTSRRIDKYELRLFSFFGPNFLKSSVNFPLASLNVNGILQPQNQTSCIFVISTGTNGGVIPPSSQLFLQVWRVNPEELGSQRTKLAEFTPYSNIQPTFCPTALNQDLIDSRYIIIKSWCGGKSLTYSMKLDIELLQVTEFLSDRLINKTGDICPSRASFVKILDGKLTGYTSSAGKGIVNMVSYYVGDLNLNEPYDKMCFINQNLLVIGQQKNSALENWYTVCFFHTDKDIEADKRLDQCVTIPGIVGVITVNPTDTGAYVQYTIANTTTLGRIYVMLSKTTIITNLVRDPNLAPWPISTHIYFEFVSKGAKTEVQKMALKYERPQYSPVFKKFDDKEIAPDSLNGTLLEEVTKIVGPCFKLELSHADAKEEPPSSTMPYIEDLVMEGKAFIRAPIFSSFDIFKAAGPFVLGIVNYPYGFAICVYDSHYLQDPIVSSFMGLVAHNAQVTLIEDNLYLLIQGSTIGDSSMGLLTYRATTADLVFESAGSLSLLRSLLAPSNDRRLLTGRQ